MAKALNLVGKKFGRLTVICRDFSGKHTQSYWKCICECGKTVIIRGFHLTTGYTRSCGCLSVERSTKHNMSNTRLYKIWTDMKRRCTKPKCKCYGLYGGRGIKVCDEWQHFEIFRDWALANGYADNLTIDRIDCDGDYCSENCRWATFEEQANNTRRCRYVIYNGEKMTVSQLAIKYNVERKVLSERLKNGWDVEKALTTPAKKKRLVEYNGVKYPLADLSKKFGISINTLDSRLNTLGWSVEEAIMTPPNKKNRIRRNKK